MREDATPSRAAAADAEIRRVCGILESVANRFPPDSEESLAIRDAALAYQTVYQHQSLKTAYEQLRCSLGAPLNAEQKAHLRRLGINPDESEGS